MPQRFVLPSALVSLLLAVLGLDPQQSHAAPPEFDAEALEFFEKQVRPLLVKRCYECHSDQGQKVRGGLRLDSRQATLEGGDTGPAAVAGDARQSLLVDAINYGDIYQMPPKSKLPAAEIAILTRWVDMGLPWPDEETGGAAVTEQFDIAERKAAHWAWRPLRPVAPPTVRQTDWPQQSLDAFILAGLEAARLSPAPTADRRTLIRRVYFDVVGLPPSPEQVEAFVSDSSPGAYERLVDQLLKSPQFGERWARHWLDLVRYAESRGHEFDYDAPNAFQYRDYVIRALNADVPYDQFVVEHIAGDLVNPPRTNPQAGFNESVLGTGFWFLGEWVHSPVDIRKDETDRFDNMVDVFGKTFLGLTVACARCHDHKFDAISQRDYYALFGYLQSSAYRQVRFETREHNREIARRLACLRRDAARRLATQLGRAHTEALDRMPAYLLAARRALREGPPPLAASSRVFADFETGDYGGWTAEGDAFLGGPQTLESIADYQGKINAQGRFFVNSHNVQAHGQVRHTDRLTGTLTSPEFVVEHDFIDFLVGGGAHQERTCVNLLVDGHVVRSATGRNNNQMFPHRWQVRDLRGRKARIQIVDRETGGWGNIGADHFVLANDPHSPTTAQFPPAFRQRLAALAADAGLSADRLADWVACVLAAAAREDDPLHAWALMCRGGDESSDAAALDAWIIRQRQQLAQSAKALSGARVIADFDRLDPSDWRVDGPTFGTGPRRTGELTPREPDAPQRLSVATYGAAIRDPVWNGLARAAGVVGEPGKLSAWDRAGRTLRTRSFDLQDGRLHYLVRGAGLAYAVVDSHRMINGPLHGGLLKPFRVAAADGPRWISHDLRPYRGHGVHVEFVAVGDEPLEVLKVVEAEQTPANPLTSANGLLLDAVVSRGADAESLAARYAALFTDVAQRLAGDALSTADSAADYARLAGWLLEHNGLLLSDGPLAAARHEAEQFAQRQAALVGEIHNVSQTAMAMWDGDGVDDRLLVRGNPRTPGPTVPRRFLEALSGERAESAGPDSGRLELAHRVVDPGNPFVSRVIVNRVWHHLTGRGLVASVDNFGVLGQPPTHPELLDHLALEFIEDGWSLKRLIRRILLSSTYQMASAETQPGDEADPENRLLHRMRVRRLEGEAVRDVLLKLSGRLDPQMYGPSVPVYLTPFMQGRGRPRSGPLDGAGRRSVYVAVRRNFLSPMMLAFDMPQPFSTQGRRSMSNVPAQALILLNDPFVADQTRSWARRLLAEHPDERRRIDRLYGEAFGRVPRDDEVDRITDFIQRQGREYGLSPEVAGGDERVWSDLCHAIVNVKEFIFIN